MPQQSRWEGDLDETLGFSTALEQSSRVLLMWHQRSASELSAPNFLRARQQLWLQPRPLQTVLQASCQYTVVSRGECVMTVGPSRDYGTAHQIRAYQVEAISK